jgi:hypothetical protein
MGAIYNDEQEQWGIMFLGHSSLTTARRISNHIISIPAYTIEQQ